MKENKDNAFIQEHIVNRQPFDAYENESKMQDKAKKAFYAVWSNWVFINPTTENLRSLEPEQYAIIKKMSYGTKNRLQSYIAYHLNRDHYDMHMDEFSEDQSFAVIEMCREVFEETKLLVDWWRKPLQDEPTLSGEEWFKRSKERFQHRKLINKRAFCFIDLSTKQFLTCVDGKIDWTRDQEMATRFNSVTDELIADQENQKTFDKVEKIIKVFTKNNNLKMFIQQRNEKANDLFV